MKKRVGIALGGMVLAAGLVGGVGFATPGSPHCAALNQRITNLKAKQAAETNPVRKAQIGVKIAQAQQQYHNQCVPKPTTTTT
jgi:hypothetical protein